MCTWRPRGRAANKKHGSNIYEPCLAIIYLDYLVAVGLTLA
jgi:hypothetical protein